MSFFCCACTYAYVAVIRSEDTIKKSVFVLRTLRAYVYAYACAPVKTSLNREYYH